MKIYCPYENVSCLLFVAFWWKEVVLFSSFRQFKPIAVPRPVVLSTGSNALRPYNDWAVACSVQHWVWSTLPVRSLSRCIRSPSVTAVKIFHSTVATAAHLAVHKDSSGFEGNLIRQHGEKCQSFRGKLAYVTIERVSTKKIQKKMAQANTRLSSLELEEPRSPSSRTII